MTSLNGRNLSASLTVADLQKSLVWYRDVIGFAVHQEYEREGKLLAVSLRAGDVRLLISQDDGAKGTDRAKGAGFSLMITTDDNIDELATRIKDAGVTLDLEPADMPWGARAFRLHDPDGFKLTISSDPAASGR
jgi:lactoylglutathione lyase